MELELKLKEVERRCPHIARVYSLERRSVRGFPLTVIELSDNPGEHELRECAGVGGWVGCVSVGG